MPITWILSSILRGQLEIVINPWSSFPFVFFSLFFFFTFILNRFSVRSFVRSFSLSFCFSVYTRNSARSFFSLRNVIAKLVFISNHEKKNLHWRKFNDIFENTNLRSLVVSFNFRMSKKHRKKKKLFSCNTCLFTPKCVIIFSPLFLLTVFPPMGVYTKFGNSVKFVRT